MAEREAKLTPTILVVFGVTGDLSRHRLLPALQEIMKAKALPTKFKMLGITRQDIALGTILSGELSSLEKVSQIFKMDMAKASEYRRLKKQINELSKEFGTQAQVIFYLSIPPATILPVIRHLGEAGLNTDNIKLLLEKPFGVDLASAQELIKEMKKYFDEDQQYRIDHYLAKEMAQNVAVFLGSNALLRGAWNRRFIEEIQIIMSESIGIEGRAIFYEQTGALRDVVQSHLLQLAALVLMEPSSDTFDVSELPPRRLKALRSLRPIDTAGPGANVVRAQYEGYQDEVKNPGSLTETFVSLKLESKNRRWSGVPIYISAGKKLSEKSTEIRIYFKKAHVSQANLLVLHIQPREGLELDLWVKEPGYERKLQRLPLRFAYEQHFGRLPDAYEQVLVDAMRGSHGLFASSAEVLATWSILQPLLSQWNMSSADLQTYKPGTSVEKLVPHYRQID